jgi:hypothetical protein
MGKAPKRRHHRRAALRRAAADTLPPAGGPRSARDSSRPHGPRGASPPAPLHPTAALPHPRVPAGLHALRRGDGSSVLPHSPDHPQLDARARSAARRHQDRRQEDRLRPAHPEVLLCGATPRPTDEGRRVRRKEEDRRDPPPPLLEAVAAHHWPNHPRDTLSPRAPSGEGSCHHSARRSPQSSVAPRHHPDPDPFPLPLAASDGGPRRLLAPAPRGLDPNRGAVGPDGCLSSRHGHSNPRAAQTPRRRPGKPVHRRQVQRLRQIHKIRIRHGAVGQTHSLGLIDRFFRALKQSLGLPSRGPGTSTTSGEGSTSPSFTTPTSVPTSHSEDSPPSRSTTASTGTCASPSRLRGEVRGTPSPTSPSTTSFSTPSTGPSPCSSPKPPEPHPTTPARRDTYACRQAPGRDSFRERSVDAKKQADQARLRTPSDHPKVPLPPYTVDVLVCEEGKATGHYTPGCCFRYAARSASSFAAACSDSSK